MKNLKTLFAIGGMALLAACSTPKETTSTTAHTNRGRSNVEANSKVSTKASENLSSSRNVESPERANLKRMYHDLAMTSGQISRFENQWKKYVDSRKAENRDKEMNNYERIEYQDKILRDILDDSQFEFYQKWVRANAGKN